MSNLLSYHSEPVTEETVIRFRNVDRKFDNPDKQVTVQAGEWIVGVETLSSLKIVRTWSQWAENGGIKCNS